MRRANERWCYFITTSPIGWAHTQKDPSAHNFFQVSMNNIYHSALQFNHFTVFVCSDCIVRKRCSYITNELELHFFHTYLLLLTYWGAKWLKFRKQNFQLHFLSMKMFEIWTKLKCVPDSSISWLIEAEWSIYVSVTKPPLVQKMACRLVGAKLLSDPMLEYC